MPVLCILHNAHTGFQIMLRNIPNKIDQVGLIAEFSCFERTHARLANAQRDCRRDESRKVRLYVPPHR